MRSEVTPLLENILAEVWGWGAGAVVMLQPYSPRQEFVRRYEQVQTTDYDKARRMSDLQLHTQQQCGSNLTNEGGVEDPP